MKTLLLFVALAAAIVIGPVEGYKAGKDASSREWQKTTVDRGLAIYCPSNGKWAWLGECKQ